MAPPPSTQHIFFETAAAAGAGAEAGGSRQVRQSASTTSSAPARLPGYQAPSQNARHPPPFHPHRGLQDRRPPRLLFRGWPRPAPPPSRRAQSASYTTGGNWPSQHQNSLNTGSTLEVGPGANAGDCRVSFFDISANTSTRFYSSGFTSAERASYNATNAHFFGGTDNVLRVVTKSGKYVNESACPLAPLIPGSQAASNYGLVAGGGAWTALDGTQRLAQPSGDGAVYALAWKNCVANATACATSSFQVQTGDYGVALGSGLRSGGRRLAGEGAGASSGCVAWSFLSPANRPFLSPPQFVSALTDPGGLIIVADSDAILYSSGTVYALSAETGALKWSRALISDGTWYASLGVVPAFDAVRDILYFACGPGVIALRYSDGSIAGQWNGTGDTVVASPSLVTSGSGQGSLYLHTTLGTLWRVDPAITISDGLVQVTFAPVFKCDHTLKRFWKTDPTAACVSNPTLLAAVAEERVEVTLQGAGAGQAASAVMRRGDFGGAGGWPQTSSLAAIAALAAATRTRYAAAFPQLVGMSPVKPSHVASLPNDIASLPLIIAQLEVSLMLAALPKEDLVALRSGADWAGSLDPSVASYKRLGEKGVVALGDDYESLYPLSTPAQINGGGELALSQYVPLGLDTAGLFVISAKDGSVRLCLLVLFLCAQSL